MQDAADAEHSPDQTISAAGRAAEMRGTVYGHESFRKYRMADGIYMKSWKGPMRVYDVLMKVSSWR